MILLFLCIKEALTLSTFIIYRTQPVDFRWLVRYSKNSLKYTSLEMKRICLCALENKIKIILGFSRMTIGYYSSPNIF
jgi:hypothetical protein